HSTAHGWTGIFTHHHSIKKTAETRGLHFLPKRSSLLGSFRGESSGLPRGKTETRHPLWRTAPAETKHILPVQAEACSVSTLRLFGLFDLIGERGRRSSSMPFKPD